VQYRATLADGSQALSCWYAHPGGSCATAAASPTTSGGFAATFRNARGNAWWVETDVAAASLAGVDARVNGGAWIALSHTSWGSWAKSVNAPAGSRVEFQARAADGSVAVSAAYAWPPA
jgi:hypothetical protein